MYKKNIIVFREAVDYYYVSYESLIAHNYRWYYLQKYQEHRVKNNKVVVLYTRHFLFLYQNYTLHGGEHIYGCN